jgi:antitoxin HicB
MFYPVTMTRDDNGTVLVTFPDVPEAVTFGDTPREALANATDALLTAFDALMKDRRDIPAPSTIEGASYVNVPALEATKVALYRAMREARVNKSELGRRLHWHLPQVDRVLKIRHGSQLEQLEAAFAAVGKRLVVDTADIRLDTAAVVAVSEERTQAQSRPPMRHGVRHRTREESSRRHSVTARSTVARKIAAKKR